MSEMTDPNFIDINFKSLEEFKSFLENRLGKTVNTWGNIKDTKPPEKLLEEIKVRDCFLVQEKGVLKRRTVAAFMDVVYENAGITYQMFESKWKYGTGRGIGFAEKVNPDDINNISTILRKLWNEEVEPSFSNSPLTLDCNEVHELDDYPIEKEADSHSYPGLPTKEHIYKFLMTLKPNQGPPLKLFLIEDDGTTEYDWREVN